MPVTSANALDAQYSVLGSVLISPEVAPLVIQQTTEADYTGACRTIYNAIRKLFLDGAVIDPVTVNNALGGDYTKQLMDLMEVTPTARNVEHYIGLCRKQARMAALKDLGSQMSAAEDEDQLRDLLEKANGFAVDRPGLRICNMSDALKSFMARHTTTPEYITWPVPELNDRLYVERGDFVIIGGYPSAGKSAWALQCAWHWAQKHKVGFFSLETSSEKLFDRQMSAVVGLTMDEIKRNQIDDAGWERICCSTGTITARNLELIQAGGMSAEDIRAVTAMRGYDIILIDYLQLIQGRGYNRTEEVSRISIALHTLSQSTNTLVVALSQLSRPEKGAEDKEPTMSSLRESGQIEQDADLVMLLYLRDSKKPSGKRYLRIRKNKEGTCPKILLDFDGSHQTFSKSSVLDDEVDRAQDVKNKIKPARFRPTAAYEQLPMDVETPFDKEET